VTGRLIGLPVGLCPRSFGAPIAPAFLRPPGITSTESTAQNCSRTHPLPTALRTAKNSKCLDSTSQTTILPRSLLLTMCGVTLLRPTRGRRFWPGYRHLNPRYGTRKFEPAELVRWETGSFKLRNIGIGSVVFVGVNLMAEPCFATGVQKLARLTLGEREAT